MQNHEVPDRRPGKNKAGRKRRRDFEKYNREECKKKAEESFIEKQIKKGIRNSKTSFRYDVMVKALVRPMRTFVRDNFEKWFKDAAQKNGIDKKLKCYSLLCSDFQLPMECVPILIIVGTRK